jgi:uncharacterized protein YxjI
MIQTQQFTNVQNIWRNIFYYRQAKNVQMTHAKQNFSFDLPSKGAYLHHELKMQQNHNICIHIRQRWFTDSMTQIVKQN